MRKRKTNSNRVAVYFLALIVLSATVFAISHQIYSQLVAGLNYDPEQAASQQVYRCLIGYDDACGYLISHSESCLDDIQNAASKHAYEIQTLWYNHEDKICCRGGDEVLKQVNFSNGESYRVLWYEGAIEWCEPYDDE